MKKLAPKTRPGNNKRFCLVIIFQFFLILGCAEINTPSGTVWEPASTFHNVVKADSYRMLWSRSNLYIADWVTLGMATSDEKVFIIGSSDINAGSRLMALDIFSGDIVWESEIKYMSKVYTIEGGVYVDEEGRGGSVKKYDPYTGDELWFRQFWDSGGVLHIISYNNKLHVYLAPDKHKTLDPSDRKTVFSLFSSPPFFDSRICGVSYQTPVYLKDIILYRSNPSLIKGEVCALDYFSGETQWKTNLGVISNIVAKEDAIFVLVESGDLLALNPSTGKVISELRISFDGSPFTLYGDRTTSGGYFLAYEAKQNILIVYLGDSRQIYAFEIIEK